MNTGDTVFVLMSAALVMLMTPALALFYGGMVRNKNVLGTIMHSFVLLGIITLEWVLWGYSMSFGPDHGSVVGGLEWFGLNNIGMEPSPDYGSTIPHLAFMIFQCMFAILTPALITGAFAERVKFSAFLLFALLWATFVYNPLCHWAPSISQVERSSTSVPEFPPWPQLSSSVNASDMEAPPIYRITCP
jgi:Amt family ammonium transporter